MKSRVLRAVPLITVRFVAMALIAYAVGRLTRTEWVWWLAPLTVAVDGSFLLRTRVRESAALLSPLEEHLVTDLDARILLISSAAAAGMAALGAFAGNRPAIITGAALAIVGTVLVQVEENAGAAHSAPDNESLRLVGARPAASGRETGGCC